LVTIQSWIQGIGPPVGFSDLAPFRVGEGRPRLSVSQAKSSNPGFFSFTVRSMGIPVLYYGLLKGASLTMVKLGWRKLSYSHLPQNKNDVSRSTYCLD